MIYLLAINLQDIQDKNEILAFAPMISKERSERSKRYVHKIDQARCVMGEVLLRYILSKYYHTKNKEISFKWNEYGKPLLSNPEGIYFNISHSGDWVLCGVSDIPIGIDVEGGKADILSIAERFFTAEEYQYINQQSLDDKKDAFYQTWTLKESYIKCVGKGLSIPLDSFRFEILGESIYLYQNHQRDKEYKFQSIQLSDGYYMSLCQYNKLAQESEIQMNRMTLEELIRWKENISIQS